MKSSVKPEKYLAIMEVKTEYKIQYDCPNSEIYSGASLVVQWLGLYYLTVKGSGSILVAELRSCKLCVMAKKIKVCISTNTSY